jgi:hypothetical protein
MRPVELLQGRSSGSFSQGSSLRVRRSREARGALGVRFSRGDRDDGPGCPSAFRLKRPCAVGTARGDRRYGGRDADLRGEPVHRGEWELTPAAPARSWTTAC